MKKMLALLSATILVFSLCSCSVVIQKSSNNQKTESVSQSEIESIEKKSEIKKPQKAKITSASEYLNKMSEKLAVSDVIQKDAASIKAADGYGFEYGGNSFEIYRFTDKEELKEAESGTYSFTIIGAEAFGEITTSTVVNGDFVLFYDVADENVISVFNSIKA